MNPLINIDITLYFEISNCEVFGGEGSMGYTEIKYGGVNNLEIIDEAFIDGEKKRQAKTLGASMEDVKLISKEAYGLATSNESYDGDICLDEGDY